MSSGKISTISSVSMVLTSNHCSKSSSVSASKVFALSVLNTKEFKPINKAIEAAAA